MKKRLGRVPLLALAIVSLACGVWGGLVRLPLNLPLPADNANWLTFHGPLMVCGFLGTVIALERAVGLAGWWTYLAPILTGAGALVLVAGHPGREGLALVTAGSGLFAAVTVRVVLMQRALFTVVMSAGAIAWLAGNALWLAGWAVNRAVPWWIGFLALTIVGERLDLSRFQRPVQWSQPALWLALGVFGGGVALSALAQAAGERMIGCGLVALALWLGRFDIARRTLKQPGLPRFMAVCLLSGYVWLAGGGVLMMFFSPLESGFKYDAVLHSFFVGFVFSMIFGHAPVIFPSVLQLPLAFSRWFYGHLVLLHLALVLRVASDLAESTPGRQWGGILNAVALAVFLGNTIFSLVRAGMKAKRET